MDFVEKTIESEVIYSGKIVELHRDKAELVNGSIVLREVVEHAGGAVVVPVDRDGNVIVVRQFRYPFGRELLEFPAGKLEKGEDPFLCAKRELSEETGYTSENYVFLGEFYPSPGYCHESLFIYLATNLIPGGQHLDQDEFLKVERMPLDALVDAVMAGEVKDAKTVIGALKAQRYLSERK